MGKGIHIDTIANTIYDPKFAAEVLGVENLDNGAIEQALKIHTRALRTNSVVDLVEQVLRRSTGFEIQSLRIFGHAHEGSQSVAGGINEPDFDNLNIAIVGNGQLSHLKQLSRLKGRFAADAVVELHGCSVAAGHEGLALLRALARLWNVVVRGAFDKQVSDAKAQFEGRYLEVRPDGHRIEREGDFVFIFPVVTKEVLKTDPTVKARHPVGTPVRYEDMLSMIAWKHYEGDKLLWPLIFERNRSETFTNPNRVPPGIELVVPFPPTAAEELKAIRKKGLNWQNYK